MLFTFGTRNWIDCGLYVPWWVISYMMMIAKVWPIQHVAPIISIVKRISYGYDERTQHSRIMFAQDNPHICGFAKNPFTTISIYCIYFQSQALGDGTLLKPANKSQRALLDRQRFRNTRSANFIVCSRCRRRGMVFVYLEHHIMIRKGLFEITCLLLYRNNLIDKVAETTLCIQHWISKYQCGNFSFRILPNLAICSWKFPRHPQYIVHPAHILC